MVAFRSVTQCNTWTGLHPTIGNIPNQLLSKNLSYDFLTFFQTRGSLHYQRKQGTIKKKSIKTPMHLQCLIPPTWVMQRSLKQVVNQPSITQLFSCSSILPLHQSIDLYCTHPRTPHRWRRTQGLSSEDLNIFFAAGITSKQLMCKICFSKKSGRGKNMY